MGERRLQRGFVVIVRSRGTAAPFEVVSDFAELVLRACNCWATFPDGIGGEVEVEVCGRSRRYRVVVLGTTAIGGDMAGKQVTELRLRAADDRAPRGEGE